MGLSLEQLFRVYGGESFDRIQYFPGAPRTTAFGHDVTFGTYRIHLAVDRAHPDKTVYVPISADRIDFESPTKVAGFGTLLRLWCSEIDAEIRIAHLSPQRMRQTFLLLCAQNAPVSAGTVIGFCGSEGLSTGPHTHLEIVSFDQESRVLEELIVCKYGRDSEITETDVERYADEVGLNYRDAREEYLKEMARRRIEYFGTYKAVRYDYMDGKLKTFYDSWNLFGF